jgi:hypothetical protein
MPCTSDWTATGAYTAGPINRAADRPGRGRRGGCVHQGSYGEEPSFNHFGVLLDIRVPAAARFQSPLKSPRSSLIQVDAEHVRGLSAPRRAGHCLGGLPGLSRIHRRYRPDGAGPLAVATFPH